MYDGITTELNKNPRQQVLQIGILGEKKGRLETRMGWEEVPALSCVTQDWGDTVPWGSTQFHGISVQSGNNVWAERARQRPQFE